MEFLFKQAHGLTVVSGGFKASGYIAYYKTFKQLIINKRASVINLSVTTLIILRVCPFIVAWFLPFRGVRNV